MSPDSCANVRYAFDQAGVRRLLLMIQSFVLSKAGVVVPQIQGKTSSAMHWGETSIEAAGINEAEFPMAWLDEQKLNPERPKACKARRVNARVARTRPEKKHVLFVQLIFVPFAASLVDISPIRLRSEKFVLKGV